MQFPPRSLLDRYLPDVDHATVGSLADTKRFIYLEGIFTAEPIQGFLHDPKCELAGG